MWPFKTSKVSSPGNKLEDIYNILKPNRDYAMPEKFNEMVLFQGRKYRVEAVYVEEDDDGEYDYYVWEVNGVECGGWFRQHTIQSLDALKHEISNAILSFEESFVKQVKLKKEIKKIDSWDKVIN